jgi:hypothetical protein
MRMLRNIRESSQDSRTRLWESEVRLYCIKQITHKRTSLELVSVYSDIYIRRDMLMAGLLEYAHHKGGTRETIKRRGKLQYNWRMGIIALGK